LPSGFKVTSIPKEQTYDWLLHKHYAKRIPSISYAFGLYDGNKQLQGVCTFGTPPRMLNSGHGCFGDALPINTYELNRLVVNGDLPKNCLSYFVSSCLKYIDKPACIVSYADASHGHHGYIYQATNWIYTGITAMEKIYIDKETGTTIHPRTVVSLFGSREEASLPKHIEVSKETSGKHRYFKFLGNKRQIKKMNDCFKYPILSYPKGDNKRYDASYQPNVQQTLFL